MKDHIKAESHRDTTIKILLYKNVYPKMKIPWRRQVKLKTLWKNDIFLTFKITFVSLKRIYTWRKWQKLWFDCKGRKFEILRPDEKKTRGKVLENCGEGNGRVSLGDFVVIVELNVWRIGRKGISSAIRDSCKYSRMCWCYSVSHQEPPEILPYENRQLKQRAMLLDHTRTINQDWR